MTDISVHAQHVRARYGADETGECGTDGLIAGLQERKNE